MPDVKAVLADLVSAGTLGIGVVAAAGALAIQGASGADAVKFAGVTMVGATLGDLVLTWAKVDTKIESFLPNSSYFDPLDFVSGGASMALLGWYVGLQGESLTQATVIAAVAGGVGRKVGGMLSPKHVQAHAGKGGVTIHKMPKKTATGVFGAGAVLSGASIGR